MTAGKTKLHIFYTISYNKKRNIKLYTIHILTIKYKSNYGIKNKEKHSLNV